MVSMARAAGRLGLAVLAVGLATLVLVPAHFFAGRAGLRATAPIARLWNRIALGALGWRVRVKGRPAEARPLLIAANHVSWGDVVAMAAFCDVAFIAKSEVAGWPLFGLLAKLHDTVFIERERRSTARAQALNIAGRLERGDALVLFPEGTTADGNALLPFKSSLFGALDFAAEDGRAVTVQPLAVAYTKLYGLPMGMAGRTVASWIGERSLGFHLWLLARHGPLDLELVFGEPLPVMGVGRKAVAAEAEAAVRRLLAETLRG